MGTNILEQPAAFIFRL